VIIVTPSGAIVMFIHT